MNVASLETLERAVSRAREAQEGWKTLPFSQRARTVRRFRDSVLRQRDRILDTIQSETGKARRDALTEIITVAGTARYYLENGARYLRPKRRHAALPGMTSSKIIQKPYGVVGLITPWNYPFLLGIADAIPALLAGNAVVTKPSVLTPLSAELAREVFIESGLDPALLAVVHGEGDVGSELIRRVDYIGFTGSTDTGRRVAIAASERLIPFSLELGGKNPMVVLEGASLEDAARSLMAGAFSNSGQTCISVERVYVQESIFDEFTRRLVQQTSALKLGWSKSWDIDMGSMISVDHAMKVLRRVQRAANDGARMLAGGKVRTDLGPSFIEPTILSGVDHSAPISREETFGPVVTLHPIRNAEEAVRLANDSEFGLNASVWAGDRYRAQSVARQLETGSAVINSTLLIYSSFDVPMGGFKLSGLGRRHGEHGILRYTQSQSIVSSIEAGGGYDGILGRIRNERAVKMLLAALKFCRRL